MKTEKRWGIPKPEREWLAKKFWLPPKGEGLTTIEIAKLCGVSKRTVGRWLKFYDIQSEGWGRRRTKGRKWHTTVPPKTELASLYLLPPEGEGKTLAQLATHYEVATETIRGWLHACGLTQRFPERHAQRMVGKNNPAYSNGGSHHYVHRELSKVKPIQCDWCKTTRKVQVHHINHNRKNNDLSNITWLCQTCNLLEAQLWALQQSGRATLEWSDQNGYKTLVIRFGKGE